MLVRRGTRQEEELAKGKKHEMTRKELTEKDQVLTTLEKGWQLLEKHAYKVAGFMLGALVISGGWALWGHLSYKSRTEGCRAFAAAITIYDAPILPGGMAKPKGMKVKTFPSIQDRAKAALAAFDKVLKEHSSHGLAVMAQFYRAACFYQLGKYDDAIKGFKAFLAGGGGGGCSCGSSAARNGAMEAVALENLGYCYEAKQEFKKALDAFKDMAKADSGIKKDWATYHQARMLEQLGRISEAIATYQKVKTLDKDALFSPVRPLAEQRAAFLEAKTGKSAPVARPSVAARKVEAGKTEPRQAEPRKAESRKAEPRKAEPRRSDARNVEPRKAEPRKAEPRKAESRKGTPAGGTGGSK